MCIRDSDTLHAPGTFRAVFGPVGTGGKQRPTYGAFLCIQPVEQRRFQFFILRQYRRPKRPAQQGIGNGLDTEMCIRDRMTATIFSSWGTCPVLAASSHSTRTSVSYTHLPAKFLAQRLRPVYGQTVVHRVPWVKADNVVVALSLIHIFAVFSSHSRAFTRFFSRINA